MFVVLRAVGNPDFDEPRDLGIRERRREVATFGEAVQACEAFRDEHSLGGGNWARECGSIVDGGRVVARVSYNGRVWATDGSEIHLATDGRPMTAEEMAAQVRLAEEVVGELLDEEAAAAQACEDAGDASRA